MTAQGAIYALRDKLCLQFDFIEQATIGFAVVFPDIDWSYDGAEWDEEMVCDAKSIRNLEQWFNDLFKYWTDKRKKDIFLTQAQIDMVSNFLRPEIRTEISTLNQVENINQQIEQLTIEQTKIVDLFWENPRIICKGGAGTGKTFLAIKLLQLLSQGKDKQILFVCKSSWLKNFVSTKFQAVNVVFSTIESSKTDMKRKSIDSYDFIIVDEGQDLLTMQDLDLLNKIIKSGFYHGKWCFFHDKNNQSNILSKVDPDSYEWLLTQNNPVLLSLTENCRNSKNIINAIERRIDCDLGKSSVVNGQEVIEVVGKKDDLAKELVKILNDLKKSAINSSSITILSPFDKYDSLLSLLPKEINDLIIELDDYAMNDLTGKGITFAQIQNFKGLENDVVILIDLAYPNENILANKGALYYVGMSRARAILYCFWVNEVYSG